MIGYCGACGANLGKPSVQIMHPSMGDDTVLCGVTATRTKVTDTKMVDHPITPEPTTTAHEAARREFVVVMEALAYHARHEDTPCEVSTESGWMDMADLLEPLGKALGDA